MSATATVTGFEPGVNGLAFPNAFAHAPTETIELPLIGRVPLGDAANGLCGGMVFTVRDLVEHGRRPPADASPPAPGSPVFAYVARRLIDSLCLPDGPLRYYLWMRLPDEDTPHVRGVTSMTRGEAERVRSEIRAGHLCCLGLVRVHSPDPRELGKNHQVLAYAYDVDDLSGRTTFHLYDPNHPGADTQLTFNTSPTAALDLAYSTGESTRGFFVTRYERTDPRPLFGEAPPPAPIGSIRWMRGIAGRFAGIVSGALGRSEHG